MALQTALLTAIGIRHSVLNELEEKKKDINSEKFLAHISKNIKIRRRIKNYYRDKIDAAKKDCESAVVRTINVFKGSSILFLIQILILLGYEAIQDILIYNILIFLVVIALGVLLLNSWWFAGIITLPNDLDKQFDKYTDELEMLISLEELLGQD